MSKTQHAGHWSATLRLHGLNLLVLLALGLLLLNLSWVGFTAADDDSYRLAALAWLDDTQPNLGTSHWALRHTIVLPIAASIALFGDSEFALLLPSVMYFALLSLAVYCFVARITRPETASKAALIATAAVMVLPICMVEYTRVVAEVAELFWAIAALFTLVATRGTRREVSSAVLAGLMLGLAALTRETAAQLAVILAVVFLMRPQWISRKAIVLCGAAAALVVGTEMLVYQIVHGDPLYRLMIDLHHGDAGGGIDRISDRGAGALSREGNIQVHWAIDPFLVILINEEFALTFWLGIAFAIALFRNPALVPTDTRKLISLLFAFATASFVLVALAGPVLNLLPRYFMFSAVLVSVALALALPFLMASRPVLTSLFVAASLSANLLAVNIENRQPIALERTLVDTIAADSNIHVLLPTEKLENDTATLAHWRGVPPGTLTADRTEARDGAAYWTLVLLPAEAGYDPDTQARAIAALSGGREYRLVDPGQPLLARTLAHLRGPLSFLHPDIRRRLMAPNRLAILVRG
jgi:4-amino-4-deoxy-L-arabinose transferase-like glycosyltransferase